MDNTVVDFEFNANYFQGRRCIERGRHGVDAHVNRAGAFYDHTWIITVLCRDGAQ
jgi:hypothetical protein